MTSGFENCPISLGLSVIVTTATLFRGNSAPGRYGIDTSALLGGNISRLFTGHFCFSSVPQMFIGVMLLYTMRQFERQLGPRKFAAFVAVSYSISTLTQMAIVTTASSMGIKLSMSSGPYFLIYSLLALYNKHVPKLHPSRTALVGGLRFSEKTWTYLFALQLLLGEGSSSVCAGVSGAVAGLMYMSNSLGLQQFRLPSLLERLCSPLAAMAGFPPRPNTATPAPFQRPARPPPPPASPGDFGDFGGFGGVRGGGVPPVALTPPSEEAIQTIMNLGFDRDRAIQALQSTGNNIEAAANMLFSS